MKMTIVIFLGIHLVSSMLFAEERSYEDIQNVALNLAAKLKPSTKFSCMNNELETEDNNEYSIVKLSPKGWVMISKNDIYKPVIGYNLEDNFDAYSGVSLQQFQIWAKSINLAIKQAKRKDVADKNIMLSWETLAVAPEIFQENLLYGTLPVSLFSNIKKIDISNRLKSNKKILPQKVAFKKAHITSLRNGSVLTGSNITLKWDKNSATKVYLYIFQPSPFKTLFGENITDSSKTITELPTNGEEIIIRIYSYSGSQYKDYETLHVKANKKEHVSISKRKKTARPSAPTAVEIRGLANNMATLHWRDNADNETGYIIYKGTKAVRRLGANTTTYVAKNLKADTVYTYSIKAYNSEGISLGSMIKFRTKAIPTVRTQSKATSRAKADVATATKRTFESKVIPTAKTRSKVAGTEIAHISKPTDGTLVAVGDTINVTWTQDPTIKTYLMVGRGYEGVRAYGGVKVSTTGQSATFKVPPLYDDLLLELVSSKNGKEIGRDRIKLYPDANRVQGTHLVHPYSLMESHIKVKPGTRWTVEWKNYGATYDFLVIQYFNSKTGRDAYIYQDYMKKDTTSYTFTVPVFSESIKIGLYSYNASRDLIAKDYYSLGLKR